MPTSSYAKTIGGKLQLKGGISLKKKKKKSKKKKDVERKEEKEDEGDFELVKLKGTGRLVSSGTTIMGQMGTKFSSELSVGDAVIIQHPTTFQEETRIVKMVLSDVSISISSPFSSDLISSTSFYYIKAPPDAEDQEKEKDSKKRKAEKDEVTAFGTYAGGTSEGTQYTYRVKKKTAYGGYTIIKETADSNRSREELLDIRSKMKADRHCY